LQQSLLKYGTAACLLPTAGNAAGDTPACVASRRRSEPNTFTSRERTECFACRCPRYRHCTTRTISLTCPSHCHDSLLHSASSQILRHQPKPRVLAVGIQGYRIFYSALSQTTFPCFLCTQAKGRAAFRFGRVEFHKCSSFSCMYLSLEKSEKPSFLFFI